MLIATPFGPKTLPHLRNTARVFTGALLGADTRLPLLALSIHIATVRSWCRMTSVTEADLSRPTHACKTANVIPWTKLFSADSRRHVIRLVDDVSDLNISEGVGCSFTTPSSDQCAPH